jgi:hypothetical protein
MQLFRVSEDSQGRTVFLELLVLMVCPVKRDSAREEHQGKIKPEKCDKLSINFPRSFPGAKGAKGDSGRPGFDGPKGAPGKMFTHIEKPS